MLFIYGCGGHARSVADVAVFNGQQSIIFIDQNAKINETALGFPLLKETHGNGQSIVALGNNAMRAQLFNALEQASIVSVIAKDAYISQYAEIKLGAFIGHGAYLGPNAVIGLNTIINTHCVIEHDCVIGNHAHISINATIAGKARIGDFVTVGAGAIVIDGVSVSDNITIGAGAVVIKDLHQPGTYVGIPAQKIK